VDTRPADNGAMAETAPDTTLAELVRRALAHATGEGVHATALPSLQVLRLDAPGTPLPATYEPGVVLVLQGRKVAELGPERLVYDPLHCLVVGITMLPLAHVIEASSARPYLCLRLQLDPAEVGRLVLEMPAAPRTEAPGCGLQVVPSAPALQDAALRLMRLLDTPADLPVLAPLLRREIAYRVLSGALGPRLRTLMASDGHAQRIRRAVDLLKRRFDEPLRVDELARSAAMSASSFHHHFKQVTAMSPLQYQKQLRLQRARDLMLGEQLDAAAAAHRVGYESASQFSREYRRLFGAPPRAALRQLRAVADGD